MAAKGRNDVLDVQMFNKHTVWFRILGTEQV